MPETDSNSTPQPGQGAGADPAPDAPPTPQETAPVEEAATQAPPSKKRDAWSWLTVLLIVVIVAQFAWVLRALNRNISMPTNQPVSFSSSVRPAPGGPSSPTGPRFVGPQGTGAPGEPGPPIPRFDLQEFAGGLIVLQEAGLPISAAQRTQCLELLRAYAVAARKVHEASVAIYRILNADQRRQVLNPATRPSSPPGTPTGPGRNPLVESLIAALEPKAGTRSAEAQPDTIGLPMPSERFTLLNGLGSLASSGSLTAEQCRSALDALKIMQDALFQQYELEGKLAALLTPEQRTSLASKDVAHDTSVTAWLVARYLERK